MNKDQSFAAEILTGLVAIGVLMSACAFMWNQSFANAKGTSDVQKAQTVMGLVRNCR